MTSDPVRFGVVGLGRAGWDIHVAQLRGREDVRIVAVADPVAERREQAVAEFACRAHESIDSLLAQDDVEVVIVATPSAAHAPDTLNALSRGRHVVVEKPMALSLTDADAMIDAADRARRQLFVHQNYRFFPEFLLLREMIDGGTIGRVFHIRNYISSFARRNDWQTLSKNGGGVLNNTAVHFIDQILQLLPGKVARVTGSLQQIASAGDVEDHVKALLRDETGATADLEISTAENIAVPLPKWVLCGTTGTLTCDGPTMTVRWFDPAQVKPLQAIDGPAQARRYGNDDQLPWQERKFDVPPREPRAFYDNVIGVLRRNEPMRVQPRSVRETMRVIQMIRDSARAG